VKAEKGCFKIETVFFISVDKFFCLNDVLKFLFGLVPEEAFLSISVGKPAPPEKGENGMSILVRTPLDVSAFLMRFSRLTNILLSLSGNVKSGKNGEIS